MSKRKHSSAFADTELISIKYNASDDIIKADSALVKLVSGAARGLPRDAQVWDVSHFRSKIDNERFSREVVVAWLNAAYQHVYGAEFEHQSSMLVSSASGVCQLGAFADAVDSTDPVSAACVAGVTDIVLEVKGIGEKQLQLHTSKMYLFSNDREPLQLRVMANGMARAVEGAVAGSDAEKEQFGHNLAVQTEQLLDTAYKLQSGALIKHIHMFIANNRRFPGCVLRDHIRTVLSKGVSESALGPNSEGSELWVQAVVSGSSAGPLISASTSQVLEPLVLDEASPEPIKFKARVNKDVFGFPAGTIVSAEFDLFKCLLKCGGTSVRVQVQGFGE